MAPLRALRELGHGSTRLLALSVALSVLQSALLIPIALSVQYAFDTLIPQDRIGRLALVTAGALVLYALSAAVGLVTRYVVLGVTKRGVTRLRAAALERLHELPRSWFDRHDRATVHATVVQDSERLDVMSNALIAQLVPAAVIGTALTITLGVLDPLLLGLLLLAVPVLFALNIWLGGAVKRRTAAWQSAYDAFSRRTSLMLRSMTLTKAHALEADALADARRELELLGRAGRATAWRASAYTLVQGTVSASGGAAVLVGGGAAVASGRLSLGELLSFYAVAVLLRGQLAVVLMTMPHVIAGNQSLARIRALLDEREREPYAGTRRIELAGELELDSVTFRYDGTPVLRGASLSIEPGEWVALLGPNGAGKSTIARLLLGLYRPESGCVRADGVELAELDLRHLRGQIGAVLDEPILFPATIAENIAYGRPGAGRERVREAAELAAVTDFADDLADGLDTLVGDDGVLLSAGQRQRVAIARALVREPPFLVLDEPTDHLDADASGRVLANLRALPGRPSVLLVTHDPAVARIADRAYYVADGRAVERESELA
jgi:ABC-type multidrug transport system fused ATPase/permease subunit